MTKQEQIEEMARIIEEKAFEFCDRDGGIYSDKLAKILFLAGYRRMPVKILHIDINEELKKDFFTNEIEKVRKETAKEILIYLRQFEGYANIAAEELAEEYGVEVEE